MFCLHNREQSFNVVWGNSRSVLSEPGTYRYAVWGQHAELLCVETVLYCSWMFTCLQSLDCEGQQGLVSKPSSEWPSSGGIRFQNVTLCYRKGLPDVLKSVSFSIQPGEKLGMAAISSEVKCMMGRPHLPVLMFDIQHKFYWTLYWWSVCHHINLILWDVKLSQQMSMLILLGWSVISMWSLKPTWAFGTSICQRRSEWNLFNFDYCMSHVAQFRYLGTTVTNQNLIQEEIKMRLNSGNACWCGNHHLLSNGR
jgi:hypothetical protein